MLIDYDLDRILELEEGLNDHFCEFGRVSCNLFLELVSALDVSLDEDRDDGLELSSPVNVHLYRGDYCLDELLWK